MSKDIEQFVEDMDFDTLLRYADEYEVEYDDPSTWLDDMWVDIEEEIRVKVLDAMLDEQE
jgi:hypothetical protein